MSNIKNEYEEMLNVSTIHSYGVVSCLLVLNFKHTQHTDCYDHIK